MVSGVRFHHVLLLSTVSTDVPRIDPVLGARFADDAVQCHRWPGACRMGFTTPGLPLSLQIAGRPFDEATVLRAAYAYEKATPWRKRRPVLDLAGSLPTAPPPALALEPVSDPATRDMVVAHVTARAVAERRPDRDDLCCGFAMTQWLRGERDFSDEQPNNLPIPLLSDARR